MADVEYPTWGIDSPEPVGFGHPTTPVFEFGSRQIYKQYPHLYPLVSTEFVNFGFGDKYNPDLPPDGGAGDSASNSWAFTLLNLVEGVAVPFANKHVSDEGGDLITLANSDPDNVSVLKYKIRLIRKVAGGGAKLSLEDPANIYPKIGYCYGAVPGGADVVTISPAKDLLTFSLPPLPLGDYHIGIYDTEGVLRSTVSEAISVKRRNRSRVTYEVRSRLPPLYLTGPTSLSFETPYLEGNIPGYVGS